ncbi:hypothetical protein HDV62DRAFT_394763 [Trichoderma sp. SZMC 28011]
MAPKATPATTPDSGAGPSAKPTGTWDNIALLNDLLVAFYQVGNQAGNFNTQTNEAVVAFMTAQGHASSPVLFSVLLFVYHAVLIQTVYLEILFIRSIPPFLSTKFNRIFKIHSLFAIPVIPTISATFYTLSIFTTFTIHLPP